MSWLIKIKNEILSQYYKQRKISFVPLYEDAVLEYVYKGHNKGWRKLNDWRMNSDLRDFTPSECLDFVVKGRTYDLFNTRKFGNFLEESYQVRDGYSVANSFLTNVWLRGLKAALRETPIMNKPVPVKFDKGSLL